MQKFSKYTNILVANSEKSASIYSRGMLDDRTVLSFDTWNENFLDLQGECA
jgi:hypothetical protein